MSQAEVQPVPAFQPYTPASESPAEFTLKAIVLGVVFGILFGAANAYLGLRAGLTVSTSIPVAVMTVAMFRLLQRFGRGGTLLEANLAQTTGSASSSVASGVIFTLPALFMWGVPPDLLQMVLLALCGGLLGVMFMVPLRRFLIVREHGRLPYPEGTACAEVLKASQGRSTQAKNVFYGIAAGAAFKALTSWLRAIPGDVGVQLPFIKKASLGFDLSPALFGVGYILGIRVASVMVGGGLLAALVIIPGLHYWGASLEQPLFPETQLLIRDMSASELWNRYVRYIGAGAVAAAGIMTLVRSVPMMLESFSVGMGQFRKLDAAAGQEETPRTERDLPLPLLLAGLVVVALVMAGVPQVFGDLGAFSHRLVASVCVVLFAFFFVTVAARIVGLVGVTSNPTSGMTIAALLGTATVFLALGWSDLSGKTVALMVGCVVAIAASISGDTSQDLKTGFLLGATPRSQQIGQLVGVLTSATFVCLSVMLLAETFGFGTQELPAPQATLMKLVIDGVIDQSLPWGLVGIGVGIALLCELLRIPSLPFAVGVYLPLSTMTPIFLGGLLRWWLGRKRDATTQEARTERGVLLGSGFVGGEGLLGVGIAGAAFYLGRRPAGVGTDWASALAVELVAAAAFGALVVWFVRRVRHG
ncbi:OPT family oligopeptide transporter [Luteimonas vadosa]|uniref:Oligopeptide transporter, OPT family n=1 Tax=Luteimonas vadosa TaxID=1165507 RepID=A0ABP9DVL3_9GAMM